MPARRSRPFALALATTLAAAAVASAHRRDDYVQAARIDLQPDGVLLYLDVTPGIAVAESFVAAVDQDRDGSLSREEESAYARQVVDILELKLDGRALPLGLTTWIFPSLGDVRRGEGTIRLQCGARLASLPPGAHRLFFRNPHLAGHSAYLANALVPSSSRVKVTRQRRDREQSALTIDYAVGPEGPQASERPRPSA